MKITLSNDPKDEGEEGIVYVPLSLFASIVATLHERELLPKAQVLPTPLAPDGAKWCENCVLPPDDDGNCIRCGEPTRPAGKA